MTTRSGVIEWLYTINKDVVGYGSLKTLICSSLHVSAAIYLIRRFYRGLVTHAVRMTI